ncbi:hypothetical protein DFH29DRAFT_553820 [Suillus ampliporus]|nr:hypothetical protein DFH29DRAFT_553820 [Suillus ampliporus]
MVSMVILTLSLVGLDLPPFFIDLSCQWIITDHRDSTSEIKVWCTNTGRSLVGQVCETVNIGKDAVPGRGTCSRLKIRNPMNTRFARILTLVLSTLILINLPLC